MSAIERLGQILYEEQLQKAREHSEQLKIDLDQAAELVLGDDAEKWRSGVHQAHDQIDQYAGQMARVSFLRHDFVPAVIELLRANGVEPPEEDVLINYYRNLFSTGQNVIEQENVGKGEEEKTVLPFKEFKRGQRADLTDRQIWAARARLGLIDTVEGAADLNLEERIKAVSPSDLFGRNIRQLRPWEHTNLPGAIKKLEFHTNGSTFPIDVSEIREIEEKFPGVAEVLTRMNDVETYHGKTLSECIKLAKEPVLRLKFASKS